MDILKAIDRLYKSRFFLVVHLVKVRLMVIVFVAFLKFVFSKSVHSSVTKFSVTFQPVNVRFLVVSYIVYRVNNQRTPIFDAQSIQIDLAC